jgi:hypothetical protein
MIGTFVMVWALAWLAVVIALVLLGTRLGRAGTAPWLIVIGLVLLTIEEPALTLWLGIADAKADPDGMATLVTPMARAHVLDAAVVSLAAAIGLGYVAMTGLRKSRAWARRLLGWGFVVALAMELTTTLLVFSRGLDLPGAAGSGGRNGVGWQPIAVGLLSWALGLIVGRPRQAPVAGHPSAGHADAATQGRLS